MKNDSSYGLIWDFSGFANLYKWRILSILVVLQTQVTEIWKQTLWEDRTNRMSEADVKTEIYICSVSFTRY